jgi:hypothetical protein
LLKPEDSRVAINEGSALNCSSFKQQFNYMKLSITMKKYLNKFGMTCAALLAAGTLQSNAAVIEIGNVYTGGTPEQPGPWATATFTQNGSSVDLTLKAQNLSSTEFISKWLFNLDSSLNPSSLTFSQIAQTGLFDAPSITATTQDAQIAGAGFRFDLVFGFETSGSDGGSKRFTNGDEITYTISRVGGLSVNDFLATADKNELSLTSAIHIQGIANDPTGEGSAWAGDGVPVPEPATVIAGCLLVAILAYRERARWQPALARLKA